MEFECVKCGWFTSTNNNYSSCPKCGGDLIESFDEDLASHYDEIESDRHDQGRW